MRISDWSSDVCSSDLRRLAHRRLVDHPAKLDPPLAAEKPLDRDPGLARVDIVGKAAGGAEREAEEFELVGGGSGAFAEEVEAARAHLRTIGRASCRERVCQYV